MKKIMLIAIMLFPLSSLSANATRELVLDIPSTLDQDPYVHDDTSGKSETDTRLALLQLREEGDPNDEIEVSEKDNGNSFNANYGLEFS